MPNSSSNEKLLIGRVKGAGETTYEFIYIAPRQIYSKVGEYIYYYASEHPVLCRVSLITPIRHYPEEMLSNPLISPESIAQTINFQTEGIEIYEITAQIIGYYDTTKGVFVNPRNLPKTGDPIYLASNEELSQWLFQKGSLDSGSVHIGYLLNRPDEQVPVVLSVDKFTSTHLAVLATTGAGKSYAVGVILEELLMAKNKGAILVFDPHGEYRTMMAMESDPRFKGNPNYQARVKIIDSDSIHIRLGELSFSEITRLLEGITDKMTNILRDAMKSVARETKNYTLMDIIDYLKERKDQDQNEISSIDGIIWRLYEFIANRKLISDKDHRYLPDLLRPGQLTVIDMVNLEVRDQQLTTSVLLNRILRSRISNIRGTKAVADEELLPYPVFIILEEGHRFAPASEESVSKTILKTILSEGRKFGIGVLLVSQRPGKLDSDVLSQCMTQIIMKITNPIDQKNISDSVESVSSDLMAELPGLTQGQAIVVGTAINTPVMVQIRSRLIPHGGSSISTGKEWARFYESAPSRPKLLEKDKNSPLY